MKLRLFDGFRKTFNDMFDGLERTLTDEMDKLDAEMREMTGEDAAKIVTIEETKENGVVTKTVTRTVYRSRTKTSAEKKG